MIECTLKKITMHLSFRDSMFNSTDYHVQIIVYCKSIKNGLIYLYSHDKNRNILDH